MIVCNEGNKRQVWWGFHKGIDKLVYSAMSLTTHTQMDQGVLKTTEQALGSVKPNQGNNMGLSQAQLKAGSATSLTTHTQMEQGVLKTKELIEGSVKPSHDNNMGLPQDQLKVGEVITAHDNCEIQMGLGHLVIPFVAQSSWEEGESPKAVASQSCTRVLSP